MFEIPPRTKAAARRLGVVVKPSTVKGKKLDVFKDGEKIASIGDLRYPDYASYIKSHGKAYADERRRLYHLRHKKGELSKALLW